MGKELGSKKREKREATGGGKRVKILVFILGHFRKKREREVGKKKGKRASWNSFLFFSILKGKEVVFFLMCFAF